ncbi:MAG: hypothetical protein JSW26_22355 [Desulfobacterales bacterium]|nr:MAG: hypothetical protein JSW26_22355 [Desulfobacterales bacterium]
MAKWIKKSLTPAESMQLDDHLAIADIARLAEGGVEKAERDQFLHHLNRCQRCYEILQETLKDIAAAKTLAKVSDPWWKTKALYALAASIILVIVIGGRLVFEYRSQHPRVITASFDLDQELKDILLEDDALRWEKGPRLNRLSAVLHKKGLQFDNLTTVILAKPYYQKKSLFGPAEVIHIRIEDGVAYLEVEEKN